MDISQIVPKTVVVIDYTNHRGERHLRRIVPSRVFWDRTKWHPEPQWLLEAFDVDKGAYRYFALQDIHSWMSAAEYAQADDEQIQIYGLAAADALGKFERRFPALHWWFSKGRTRHDEPLYGFAAFQPRADGVTPDAALVTTEHDDPRECIALAIKAMEEQHG